jgi:hypothetical protein
MWANDYYRSEVHTLAIPSMTGALAAKASAVAEVPSFQWMDRNVTVDTLFSGTLAQIRAANKAGANPPYGMLNPNPGLPPPPKPKLNTTDSRQPPDMNDTADDVESGYLRRLRFTRP